MNNYVKSLKNKIDIFNKKLKDYQDKCEHKEYESINNWNDHDGWSWVTINWYQNRRCKNCDKSYTVKTGESQY